jgi:hypothetical protein
MLVIGDISLGRFVTNSCQMFDSQYPTLFNNQSYVSKAETTTCVLPCNEDIWNAQTPIIWKSLVGAAEVPPPE